MSASSRKPSVFLSYSHQDEVWKDRLKTHLRVLEQEGSLVVWDDRKIGVGENWYDEIWAAMAGADAAVCLISADYLVSDFCRKEEIPYLLQRQAEHGMLLVLLLLRPCPWSTVQWLKPLQMMPGKGKSVADLSRVRQEALFSRIAEIVFSSVSVQKSGTTKAASGAAYLENLGTRMDIMRLPVTGSELFGRQEELNWLDGIWKESQIQVAALIAWGGVGKSTLVNKWLEGLEAERWGGARRVYGWSFYSQGTGDRVTAADDFIHHALEWFGDPDPTAGSPWAKGERLATRIREEKTLLILDGIEPLQSGYEGEPGAIKDSALASLLSELARPSENRWGLCLITSREPVIDLQGFAETFVQKDLEQISPPAGRALLRVGGARGTDAELIEASRAFGNQALAVKLLAAYLRGVPGHSVSSAQEISELDVADEDGRHPRRVMEAFARRFGQGPKLELLQVLGLFDRPAPRATIEAVRAAPPIPGLTEHLSQLSEESWLRLVEDLRQLKLIAESDLHAPDELDAHPLIREHFSQRLRTQAPAAWREAHERLSAYYLSLAPDLPEKSDEMAPLYAALAHACKAGQYRDALHEIYQRRILRGSEGFSVYKLGTVGADLASLASFFAGGWHQPEAALSRADRIFLLERVGLYMRSLGRREAVDVLQAGLNLALEGQERALAEKCVRHLGAAYRTAGDLKIALRCTADAIRWADLGQDLFYRVANRASQGQLLHFLGRLELAQAAFHEAEALQATIDPGVPWLWSYPGFHFCELLLDLGQYKEVVDRADRCLSLQIRRYLLLDEARDHLSRGAGLLGLARSSADRALLSQASTEIEIAVEGFQRAGTRYLLLNSMLIRAELSCFSGALDRARADLENVLFVAKQYGMRLHQIDAHLEVARLLRDEGDRGRAREHLEKTRRLMAETSYGRRSLKVRDLERSLENED